MKAQRLQPVWRDGEHLRLTFYVHGDITGLRLVIGEKMYPLSVGKEAAEVVIPSTERLVHSNRSRVALQALVGDGWETIAAGNLVKETNE